MDLLQIPMNINLVCVASSRGFVRFELSVTLSGIICQAPPSEGNPTPAHNPHCQPTSHVVSEALSPSHRTQYTAHSTWYRKFRTQ